MTPRAYKVKVPIVNLLVPDFISVYNVHITNKSTPYILLNLDPCPTSIFFKVPIQFEYDEGTNFIVDGFQRFSRPEDQG